MRRTGCLLMIATTGAVATFVVMATVFSTAVRTAGIGRGNITGAGQPCAGHCIMANTIKLVSIIDSLSQTGSVMDPVKGVRVDTV